MRNQSEKYPLSIFRILPTIPLAGLQKLLCPGGLTTAEVLELLTISVARSRCRPIPGEQSLWVKCQDAEVRDLSVTTGKLWGKSVGVNPSTNYCC